MKSCAVLFTTTTGNTEWVARMLCPLLPGAVLLDARSDGLDRAGAFDSLVFCVSTWGRSEMQDDWETLADRLYGLALEGRKVAVLGLGDQKHYPEAFADGMRRMADLLRRAGGKLVGSTSTEGYRFDASLAVEEGRFLGCVVDEETQSGLTAERLEDWAACLRREFGLA